MLRTTEGGGDRAYGIDQTARTLFRLISVSTIRRTRFRLGAPVLSGPVFGNRRLLRLLRSFQGIIYLVNGTLLQGLAL